MGKKRQMTSLFSRRLKIAGVCLLLALAGLMPGSAKTLDIPTTTAHLELPGDWTIQNRNDIALYAVQEGSGMSVTVALFTNENGQGVENPQFVENMETVLRQRANKEGASVKIVNGGKTDLNGVPADFLQAELAFPEGGVAYARSYAVAENGSILVLTLLTRDPSETADAALQDIAKSLHFDRPPLLPGTNLWSKYHLGWGLLVLVIVLVAGLALLLFFRRRAA
jgi:hypothetical protein